MAGACERAVEWDRAAALATEALGLYRELGDPYGTARHGAARAALGPVYDEWVRRGRALPADDVLRQTLDAPIES